MIRMLLFVSAFVFFINLFHVNYLYSAGSSRLFDSVVFVSSSKIEPEDVLKPLPHKGMGPGILIDKQGHVLVQKSILSDVHSIECAVKDLGYWPAILIGEDKITKVALLQIKAPEKVLSKMKPANISASEHFTYGQEIKIVGVGPDGNFLFYKGNISMPFRQIEFGTSILDKVVQINTFIHRGLIGAPVFNKTNKLIGVAIKIDGNLAPNIGLFLPINEIMWIAQSIIEHGKVVRAYLGTKVINVDAHLKRLLHLPTDKGVLIVDIDKNSPAKRAGLKGCDRSLRIGNRIYPMGGDLIVAIDRIPITKDFELIKILNKKGPGKRVLISFYRDGKLRRKEVILDVR